jgi:WD40 repeat protein
MAGLLVASLCMLTGAAVFTLLIPAREPARAQGGTSESQSPSNPSEGGAPRPTPGTGTPATAPTPPQTRKEDTPSKRKSGDYAFLLGTEKVMNPLADVLNKSNGTKVEQKTIDQGLAVTLKELLDRQRWDTPKEGGRLSGSSLVLALSCPVHRFKGEKDYYLCPVGADLKQRADLVRLTDLYKLLDECPAQFKLLLLDVSRRDKVPDELEALSAPQAVAPPRGTAVLFSCSAGDGPAPAGKRDEGPFFAAIKDAIAHKDTIHDFEEYVQVRVFAETQSKQTPKRRGAAEGTEPLAGWASVTRQLPEGEIKDFRYSQQAPVVSVGFSPDGSRCLSAGENRSNSIQVHALEQKAPYGTPLFLDPPIREGFFVVRAAIFSSDGKSVLVGTGGEFVGAKPLAVGLPAASRVYLLPIAGGKDLAAPPLPSIDAAGEKGQWVLSVAISPDGTQVLAGGAVGDIGFYAFTSTSTALKELYTFSELRKKRQKRITSVVFAPAPNQALYTAEDGSIALWDTRTHKPLRSFPSDGAAKSAVYCAAFSPDGKRLLTGDDDGGLTSWDFDTGKALPPFESKHGKTVRGVAFSPDGRWAVSGSEDGTVRLWDVEAGKEIKRFEGHEGAVNSVAFAPDGRYVLSGGQDQTVRLWALPEFMRR